MKKYDSKPYKLPDYPDTDIDVLEAEGVDAEELLSLNSHLIVWNDEINTFAHVIETLIDVCHHEEIQATQCAFIIHNNGKCAVKQGSYKKLKPMLTEILDRKISATIE